MDVYFGCLGIVLPVVMIALGVAEFWDFGVRSPEGWVFMVVGVGGLAFIVSLFLIWQKNYCA